MTAHEILSILKKRTTSEDAVTVRDNTYADECQLLQSPSLVCSVIKSPEEEEHLRKDFNAEGSSPEHRKDETIMTHSKDRNISEKVADAFCSDSITQPLDCANQRVSHTRSFGLSTECNRISEIKKASASVSHQDNPSVSMPALTDVCTLTHASNKVAIELPVAF